MSASSGSKGAVRGRAARLARFLPLGPSGGTQAARTPFVLLVVLLLGGGLITLLMLNSSLNEGSFQVTKLKKQTTELTDDEQQLQREVDAYSAPDALLRRARGLGMVPGGDPAFLDPNGTVKGRPSPAAAPPAPPPAEPTESPDVVRKTPGASASPSGSGSPSPSAGTSSSAKPSDSASPNSTVKPSPSSSGR
ncbi:MULTISPECIES: septum formation initiator family protein [unclassified Streptomyces]|uniref:septum formation initiator family protein n=1 Tax=unclassified Streptomyces TaxID=2593676 RepID=UPI00278BE712|nr:MULTISPECIES: septum formation initiator family protein [unclassified Streptomyces]